MLQKTNHSTTAKLTWISKHVPISVSVASNITNFESPRCFINPDPTILIQNMMEYLRLISIAARTLKIINLSQWCLKRQVS